MSWKAAYKPGFPPTFVEGERTDWYYINAMLERAQIEAEYQYNKSGHYIICDAKGVMFTFDPHGKLKDIGTEY